MHRLIIFMFWTALAFALVMAMTSQPVPIPGNPSDKLQHMLAFAVLSVLGALAYPRVRLEILLLGLILFGGVIELIQMIPWLKRDAELLDWAVDAGAVAATLGAIAIARRCLGRAG